MTTSDEYRMLTPADVHAGMGFPVDYPTVPDHAPAGMPEPPTCPACGLIPDTTRATCLTCLAGAGPATVAPADSCHVGPAVRSQWRNGPHWHTVWPEGPTWCYPTVEAAETRATEVNTIRGITP